MTNELVIFGAGGDLFTQEILPALADMAGKGMSIPVRCVGKNGWDYQQFRDYVTRTLVNARVVGESALMLMPKLAYIDGDVHDESTYVRLDFAIKTGSDVLYYLALPPNLFLTAAQGIAQHCPMPGAKLMVEKPFGSDLDSARMLNDDLHRIFEEANLYRVDHWLGLEAVQNVIFTRLANTMFEPVLNRQHVESVTVTMAENFGVETRGAFYDRVGAIRDVVQNHVLQVIATVLADLPMGGVSSEQWTAMKNQMISAIRPVKVSDVIFGQYDGYRDHPGVSSYSTTETYVQMLLYADTWRWHGIPIIVRAGKHMPETHTEVTFTFRQAAPVLLGATLGDIPPSTLTFRVYPHSQVRLSLVGKSPGSRWSAQVEELAFSAQPTGETRPYDRLLSAAMLGQRWMFPDESTTEAAWRVVQPALRGVPQLLHYAKGTWGPGASR